MVDCLISFWLLRQQRHDQWVYKIRHEIVIDFWYEDILVSLLYTDWHVILVIDSLHTKEDKAKQYSDISDKDEGMLPKHFRRKSKSKGFECLLGRERLEKTFLLHNFIKGWLWKTVGDIVAGGVGNGQ